MHVCIIYAYMHLVKLGCKMSQNLRLIGGLLVAGCANSEVLRSYRRSLRANWASARDSFQGMRREEAKSAPKYFFGWRVDQEKLLSGC
jgi:hypothetical protein